MKNTSNAASRSIARLLALVVVAILALVVAVLTGLIPLSFAP